MKLALLSSMTLLVLSCSAQGGNGAAPGASTCMPGVVACTCPNGAPSQCGSTGTCQCGAPPVGGADTVPCNVEQVLQAKCWTCHGVNNKYGAPTEVTASGFRAMSKKDPTKTVGALAAIRVQDPTQRMPPLGNPELSPGEMAIIQAWANAGNPAGAACAPPGGVGGAASIGAGGNAPIGAGGAGPIGAGGSIPIPGAGGTTPIPGAGGTPMGAGGIPMPGAGGTPVGAGGTGTVDPPPPADATCYKILARNDVSNAPYAVPTTPDYYAAFNYALPWGTKKVQVVRTRSIINNDAVIHHWLLYNTTGTVVDGQVGSSIGAHPDASLIVGWAPGNEPATLPADVGLGIPGQGFQLEVHYNNTKGAGQTDKSGVEVCVTEKLRAHEAQVSWLGTQSLNKTTASGTCKPQLSAPVTVLFSWPHEHLQGRHLKTVITRAGGAQETLIDKPFDFNAQIVYATPATINPGDSLTTTCTYAQPTPFGQGTTAEMCYNFVTAYPGGALSNGGSFFRINDCTQ